MTLIDNLQFQSKDNTDETQVENTIQKKIATPRDELVEYYKNITIDQYLYCPYTKWDVEGKKLYDSACYNDSQVDPPQPYELIVKDLQRSADKGYGPAMVMLGYFFEHGFGVAQSYENAMQYYELALKTHCWFAYALIAQCYELGHGVQPSLQKAKQNYALSLEKSYENIKKKGVVVDYLHCDIYSNHAFVEDQSFKTDIKEKIFRFNHKLFLFNKAKAIVLADIDSIEKVIHCYQEGKGVAKDLNKALEYSDILAEQMYVRIRMLDLSIVDNLKKEKLLDFLSWNESKQNDESQYQIALCYKDGIGIELKASEILFKYFLEKAAYNNNPAALYDLARCYDYAMNGYPCNSEKAAKLYSASVAFGNAEALFELGNFYYYGVFFEKSVSKAMDCFEKSAALGNTFALGKLAIFYESSNEYAPEFYMEYYQKCAEGFFDEAKLLEDLKYIRPNEPTHSLIRFYKTLHACYQARAIFGDMDALFKLIELFRQKKLPFDDPKKSLIEFMADNYSLCAEEGHPQALRWLGYIFERQGNYQSAFECYEQAVQKDDNYSLILLAICYEEGKGTQQSLEKAQHYYELAGKMHWDRKEMDEISFDWGHVEFFLYNKLQLALGVKEAQNIVNGCYERSDGVYVPNRAYIQVEGKHSYHSMTDYTATSAYTRKTAKASYQIATNYYHGNGVSPSLQVYRKYLQHAVMYGDKKAFDEFGEKFDYGLQDSYFSYREAISYIIFGAQNENAKAQLLLGYFYERGLGVERSYAQAVFWYVSTTLLEPNQSLAFWHLGKCYENGHGIFQSDVAAFKCYLQGLKNCNYNEENAIQDTIKGNIYLKSAMSELSNIKANYSLEKSFRCLQNAFLYYRAKASVGDISALSRLAECYWNGTGVEKSEKKAIYYSKLASEQKNMILEEVV